MKNNQYRIHYKTLRGVDATTVVESYTSKYLFIHDLIHKGFEVTPNKWIMPSQILEVECTREDVRA